MPDALTLVIAVYNEADTLPLLQPRIAQVLDGLRQDRVDSRILYVDDGSTDASWWVLREIASRDGRVSLLRLSRNFGKEAALTAGLDLVGEGAALILDADGQDPPELIPEFVAKWREGFDDVYGTRTLREGEGWIKKSTAHGFYRLIGWLSKTPIPEDNGDSYTAYFSLVKSGFEEPLTTHADHFNTNYAYSNAAYAKGAVFMEQLGYIVGAGMRNKIILNYYNQWRFKHPNVNDFIQVAEKTSGLKLDWYREYFVNTTKTIDYAIDSLWEEGGKTKVRIVNKGKMPMPIDLQLTFKDGAKEMHYVPMNLMFGAKPPEDAAMSRKVYDEWNWTNPAYIIESSRKLSDMVLAEIDPSHRMADTNRKDNKLEIKW